MKEDKKGVQQKIAEVQQKILAIQQKNNKNRQEVVDLLVMWRRCWQATCDLHQADEKQIREYQETKKNDEETMASLKSRVIELEREVEVSRQEQQNKQQEIERVQEECRRSKYERTEFQRKLKKANREVSRLQQEKGKHKKDLEILVEQNADYLKKIVVLRDEQKGEEASITLSDSSSNKVEKKKKEEAKAKVEKEKEKAKEEKQPVQEKRSISQKGRPYPAEYDQVPYPEGYRVPEFKQFEGENEGQDPEAHLVDFVNSCKETRTSDCYVLRQFPLSLSGLALRWYHSLKKRSITTWNGMAAAFITKFSRKLIGEACEGVNKSGEKRKLREEVEINSSNKRPMKIEPLSKRKSKPYSFRKDKIWEVAAIALKHGCPIRLTEKVAKSQEDPTLDTPNAKFCAYHVRRGHGLEDCFIFKDWVEKEYRAGVLPLPEHVLQAPAPHE